MKELIGFWLISLVILIVVVSLESTLSIKQKIIGVIGIMVCLSLLIAGVFLMVGGV